MKSDLKILVVDDHPLFRRGLREAIEENPRFRIVAEASDGEEGMRLLLDLKPQLAIVDIDMPRMNGLEMARAIQKMNVAVGVIFLTMYKDESMFNAALDAGVKAYVLKENAAGEILAALDRVAEGRTFESMSMSGMGQRRSDRAKELILSKPQIDDLTPAERRVLKHIAEDRTSKEIADLLHISVRTVENHRLNICQKLNLHGCYSLLKFALANKANF
ncbi:MAG: response regulator transcription factor [Verrucomicrobiota bacterium]